MSTTLEERAEWWKWVRGESCPPDKAAFQDALAKLLYALESFESLEMRERADVAARLITEARIESVEVERDALAKVAAKVSCWNCPVGENRPCVELPEPDCSVMLLEWARQQARGGDNV